MRTWWNRLLRRDDPTDWACWLAAWRLWLVAGLLGATLAAALYRVAPPPPRARAEVVVDHDLEAALPSGTDRQLFYYLSRENKKLEAVAWADDVLAPVAEALGASPAALRSGGPLVLRQEKDGLWHFWVTARPAARAQTVAALWARAFTDAAQAAIAAARQAQGYRGQHQALARTLAETRFLCAHLEQVQAELDAWPPPPDMTPWQAWALWERLAWLHGGVGDLPPWPAEPRAGEDVLRAAQALAEARAAACPQRLAALQADLDALAQAWAEADRAARGLSPYLSVTPTQIQAAGLPVAPAVGPGTYMVAGALLAWAVLGLGLLFRGGSEPCA